MSDEWLKVRREWIKLNPPNHQGQWVCGICGRSVHISEMEVDHIKGRKGELLTDLSNLQPSHIYCNRLKGSKKWVPKISKEEYEFRKTLDL